MPAMHKPYVWMILYVGMFIVYVGIIACVCLRMYGMYAMNVCT